LHAPNQNGHIQPSTFVIFPIHFSVAIFPLPPHLKRKSIRPSNQISRATPPPPTPTCHLWFLLWGVLCGCFGVCVFFFFWVVFWFLGVGVGGWFGFLCFFFFLFFFFFCWFWFFLVWVWGWCGLWDNFLLLSLILHPSCLLTPFSLTLNCSPISFL